VSLFWFQQKGREVQFKKLPHKCWKRKEKEDNWHVVNPPTEQIKNVGHEASPLPHSSYWDFLKVAFLTSLFLFYTIAFFHFGSQYSFYSRYFYCFLNWAQCRRDRDNEMEFRRISKAFEMIYDDSWGPDWEREMAKYARKKAIVGLAAFSLLIVRTIHVISKAKGLLNEATDKERLDWRRALMRLRSDRFFILLKVIFIWQLLSLLLFLNNMKQDNPFEILGIPVGSTMQEVRKAYRRLSLRYHPD